MGCTPVRLTWEDHLSSLFHSEEFDELTNITGLPVLVCCTFNELRGSFWLSDLVFPGLSDALGPSDNEKLVHSPHQHLPASCLRFFLFFLKKGLTVLVMNSQLLFADSLTSTLPDWLGCDTGLPVLVYPHYHIRLMLDLILNLQYLALMSEV